MAIHFLMLINITAQELVVAQSSYAPLPGTNPVQYVQERLTSDLLQRTVLANEETLSKLHVSMEHPELKSLIRPKMTLAELARLGVQDITISWPVFQAFWAELNAPNPAKSEDNKVTARPPLLVTVDGLAHWMQDSKYSNADFKPIHAHDLALVNHFLSLLTPGSKSLPNGGILLYSTSGSNSPTLPTFELALDQLNAHQNGVAESSPEFPHPDPYAAADKRVLDLFKQSVAKKTGKKEGLSSTLELQTLGGLSREEARGFMEYFARSGLLQEKITEEWVCEKWSLAGGGIIGEMEKLGKRLRTVL
jgi:small subunit ribosomal protein S29